jgi:hypothetical protein
MFLVAAAMVSAWMITVANLPAEVVSLLQPLLDQPKLLMVAIMVLTMVVGTAMDMTPTILIPHAGADAHREGRGDRSSLLRRAVHDQQRHRPDHPARGHGAEHGGRCRQSQHG